MGGGVTSHPVQSLSKRCPSCDQAPLISDQALAKHCPSATFGGLRVLQIRHPVMSHPVQSLSKRCQSCDQAPLFLAKRLPSTVQAVTKPPSFLTKLGRIQCWEYTFLYTFGEVLFRPSYPFIILKGEIICRRGSVRPCQSVLEFYQGAAASNTWALRQANKR